jgi:hypothetical protein
MFLIVPLLTTGVARVAGGGLLYHGEGLGVTRGDDADINGLWVVARSVVSAAPYLLKPGSLRIRAFLV